MTGQPHSEIVFPREAGLILGYTRREMDVLIEYEVISHLIRKADCISYYRRSDLLAFREQVKSDPGLAACIDYLLGKDFES